MDLLTCSTLDAKLLAGMEAGSRRSRWPRTSNEFKGPHASSRYAWTFLQIWAFGRYRMMLDQGFKKLSEALGYEENGH